MWHEDGAGYTQTESELHVFWDWETGEWENEIYGAAPFHTPFTSNGWQLEQNYLEITQWNPGHWQYRGYSQMSSAGFPFVCSETGGPDTWTAYYPNTVDIYGNGSATFNGFAGKGGSCSEQLTLHVESYRDY